MFWTEGCWMFGLEGDWRRGLDGFLLSKGQRLLATSYSWCLEAVKKKDLAWWDKPGKMHQH